MPGKYRLSHAADRDFKDILNWSEDHHDDAARDRYDALVVAALKHAAASRDSLQLKSRPELGEGIVSWHIVNSVSRSTGGRVKQPRHILYCRWEDDTLAVGRILGDVV
jgi:toxin ParE1/3/4